MRKVDHNRFLHTIQIQIQIQYIQSVYNTDNRYLYLACSVKKKTKNTEYGVY